MLLSKPQSILHLAKRCNYTFKAPPKEIMEKAKFYGFTPPGFHHLQNPYVKTEHHSKIWSILLKIAVPSLIVATVRALYLEWEEEKHIEEHRPEFKPYEFMRIRRTPFPWGDGNHTLFHNPKRNPLPDGYEE